MPTSNYEDFLLGDIADPEEAAGYLSACLEEGSEVFLLGYEMSRKHREA